MATVPGQSATERSVHSAGLTTVPWGPRDADVGGKGREDRTGRDSPSLWWDPVAGQSDSCDVCRLGEFQSNNKLHAFMSRHRR